MSAEDYKNPYGIWIVTTEGDDEGLTSKKLGTYEGFLDEIAFALADKCFCSLQFTKVDKLIDDIPTSTNLAEYVPVTLSVDSHTWDMSKEELVSFFEQMLSGRDVSVDKSKFFASVNLNRKIKEEDKRRVALSKLTDEEKELLGLK